MLLAYGYIGSFLVMNFYHADWLDQPMFLLGLLGDSLLLGSVLVLIHRRDPGKALSFILVLVVSGVLAQVLKQFVFPEWDRPLKIIGDEHLVHLVNNVRLMQHSFPSGHSVSAGAAFTLLAWIYKDKPKILLLSLFLSLLIPYTRVYTGAHFPGDILAGSITGTVMTIAMIPYLEKFKQYISLKPDTVMKRFSLILTLIAVVGIIVVVVQLLIP